MGKSDDSYEGGDPADVLPSCDTCEPLAVRTLHGHRNKCCWLLPGPLNSNLIPEPLCGAFGNMLEEPSAEFENTRNDPVQM